MTATSPTILVVDDEESIRQLLARMLRQVGVIHTADSGAKALLFLQSESVDLVLSDQSMPGMTGDQLLAEVSHRWPDTARILMSGNCDPMVVDQGLRCGSIGHFIAKPIGPEDLQEIQARASSAHRQRASRAREVTTPKLT